MTNSPSSDSIKLPSRIQGLIAPVEEAVNNNDAGQASQLLFDLWYNDQKPFGYYSNSPDVRKKLMLTSQAIINTAVQNKNEEELDLVRKNMFNVLYDQWSGVTDHILEPIDSHQRLVDNYPEMAPLHDVCLEIGTDNALETAAYIVINISHDMNTRLHQQEINQETFDSKMGKALDEVYDACMLSGSIPAYKTALDLSCSVFDNVRGMSEEQEVLEKAIYSIGYVCKELIHINTEESLEIALDRGLAQVGNPLVGEMNLDKNDGKKYSASIKYLAEQSKEIFDICSENNALKANAFIQYTHLTGLPEYLHSWNVAPEDTTYENKLAQKECLDMYAASQDVFDALIKEPTYENLARASTLINYHADMSIMPQVDKKEALDKGNTIINLCLNSPKNHIGTIHSVLEWQAEEYKDIDPSLAKEAQKRLDAAKAKRPIEPYLSKDGKAIRFAENTPTLTDMESASASSTPVQSKDSTLKTLVNRILNW